MSGAGSIEYPFSLNQGEIAAVLPHRGEVLFARSLKVLSNDHYQGVASWPASLAALQGHFPGIPLVPGVYLVEALAQLAGAGLLTGDPYVMSLDKRHIGVLAAIRKTSFRQPVFPDQAIDFDIHCRKLGPLSVQVTGSASYRDTQLAQLDILLAHVSQDQLGLALPHTPNASPL